MGEIYIDPTNLRNTADQLELSSQDFSKVSGGSIQIPAEASGATRGAIGHAEALVHTLIGANNRQVTYLRTTAALTEATDSVTADRIAAKIPLLSALPPSAAKGGILRMAERNLYGIGKSLNSTLKSMGVLAEAGVNVIPGAGKQLDKLPYLHLTSQKDAKEFREGLKYLGEHPDKIDDAFKFALYGEAKEEYEHGDKRVAAGMAAEHGIELIGIVSNLAKIATTMKAAESVRGAAVVKSVAEVGERIGATADVRAVVTAGMKAAFERRAAAIKKETDLAKLKTGMADNAAARADGAKELAAAIAKGKALTAAQQHAEALVAKAIAGQDAGVAINTGIDGVVPKEHEGGKSEGGHHGE